MSDDGDERRETQLLRKEIDRPLALALRLKREFKKGQASRDELEDALVDLYETLAWFRTEDKIDEEWEERGLDAIGSLLSEWQEVSEQTHPRLSSPGTSRAELKIAQLSDEKLLNAIDALLEIAKQLGFAPAVNRPPTRSEVSREDMEEFEEWRQQQIQ